MKIGDKVPKEDYAFFIVTKDCYETDYEGKKRKVKTGTHQIIKKIYLDHLNEKSIKFFKNKCREATSQEIEKIYAAELSNAVISDVYDSSYGINFYYVPTTELDIKSVVDEKDYWGKYEKKKEFFKSIGIDDSGFYELDEKGKFIYVTIESSEQDKLLNTCRKATPEEAIQFNEEVAEMWRTIKEKNRLEMEAVEKEKQERYEANKSNAEYFPGACGNYRQIVIKEDNKINETKLYDLYAIKQFYNELINSGKIDKKLLERIILYGGTIPYVLLDTKEETRKFGDVDIFIPIENMEMFRQAIMGKPYFNMTFDSMNLTIAAQLRVKSSKRFSQPWFSDDSSDMAAYNEYERSVARARTEHRSVYQDYGFKGNLFDVNISVFPIYQWNKNNALDICAKSFRIGTEEGDNKFMLNTIVTHNTPITSFSKLVEICGGVIGAANLEYTIASKRSAINHGYLLRQETDLRDLEFMEQNKDRLGIDDNLVQHYEENIPDYGIVKVYRITRNNEIKTYTPEEYKNVVTRNHKPS